MTLNKQSQQGNILFILLVALALFAGLTLVMSDAGQSIGNGKSEKADVIANELINYANSVKIAVQKAILKGCSDTDISFENNIVAGYEHGGAGAPDKCKIFKSTGGKLRWKTPDKSWLEASYQSQTFRIPPDVCIKNLGLNGPDTSASSLFCDNRPEGIELVIHLVGIKKEICEAINKKVSGSKVIPLDHVNHNAASTQFKGVYNTGNSYEFGDGEEVLTGKQTYCFKGASSAGFAPNAYVFYSVLLIR